MLRSTGNAASPELERMVQDLLKADSDYDRNENRTAHREHLLRSILIEVRRPTEKTLEGFSRNISVSGIGLITKDAIEDRATALLTIERLKGQPFKVLAECRWCRPYGSNWQISGWLFMMIKN